MQHPVLRIDTQDTMNQSHTYKVFDSHFHIIDKQFPLVENNGFLPDYFSCDDYIQQTGAYNLAGGAIVSGSFQSCDQTYLLAALKRLGPGFVGVTQLRDSVSDTELIKLDQAGIKGVRFNLRRGGSERPDRIESFARRLFDRVGWHIELYIDSRELDQLYPLLISLPAVSIGHLGLSKEGFPSILRLVEKGIRIKATGFGRVDLDVKTAIKEICAINPQCLLFGTDLPSTRVERPYSHHDFLLIIEALGEKIARKVFYDNAMQFYFPDKDGITES